MTRNEHLEWAKNRALEELDKTGSPLMAFTSLFNDFSKHEELKEHIGLHLAPAHIRIPQEASMNDIMEAFNPGSSGIISDVLKREMEPQAVKDARKYIEGFN